MRFLHSPESLTSLLHACGFDDVRIAWRRMPSAGPQVQTHTDTHNSRNTHRRTHTTHTTYITHNTQTTQHTQHTNTNTTTTTYTQLTHPGRAVGLAKFLRCEEACCVNRIVQLGTIRSSLPQSSISCVLCRYLLRKQTNATPVACGASRASKA